MNTDKIALLESESKELRTRLSAINTEIRRLKVEDVFELDGVEVGSVVIDRCATRYEVVEVIPKKGTVWLRVRGFNKGGELSKRINILYGDWMLLP